MQATGDAAAAAVAACFQPAYSGPPGERIPDRPGLHPLRAGIRCRRQRRPARKPEVRRREVAASSAMGSTRTMEGGRRRAGGSGLAHRSGVRRPLAARRRPRPPRAAWTAFASPRRRFRGRCFTPHRRRPMRADRTWRRPGRRPAGGGEEGRRTGSCAAPPRCRACRPTRR